MPRSPLRPSPHVARLLKTRRQWLGWSASEVSRRTKALGERIPVPTLLKIEEGRQEPGLRRFYTLARLYRIPLDLVPALLEIEDLAAEPPAETDPDLLYRRASEHWRRGEIGPGLACLFALRQQAPAGAEGRLQRQRALLAFAIAAKSLGRARLSQQLISEVLVEPPDPSLRVHVLVQGAANWLQLGSTDAALAFLHQAETCIATLNSKERAWIHHQRANALLATGDHGAAASELDAALAAYAAAGDAANHARALGVRIDLLLAGGRTAEAMRAAQDAKRDAEEAGFAPIALQRQIDVGRSLLKLGRMREAEDALEEGLARALLLKNKTARFRAHYWLWKAHAAAGNDDRARVEREAAIHYLQFVDESSEETREVRKNLGERGEHVPRPRQESDWDR